ncbi:MAG: hypothetical protein WCK15_06940 [Pirellula sp.]
MTAYCTRLVTQGLRHPNKILEFPFLSGCICLYFYSYMGFTAYYNFDGIIDLSIASVSLLFALSCILAIELGWNIGMSRPFDVDVVKHSYPNDRMWWTGMVLALSATIIHLFNRNLVSNALSNGNANSQITLEGSSGYFYLFFQIGYCGMMLVAYSVSVMDSKVSKKFLVCSAAMFLAFIFPHILQAKRGPLFPFAIIVLFLPPLARKCDPRRLLVVTGFAATGFAMLLFVEARKFVYSQGSWSDVWESIDLQRVLTSKVSKITDNEFVNSGYLMETVMDTQAYQLGTGHLGLFIHWIPRQLWNDKPMIGAGWFPTSDLLEELDRVSGLSIKGSGAAAGGFADSFVQYGFFAPVFWFFLTLFFAKHLATYRSTGSVPSLFSYMVLPCCSLWLLSQGFAAAFVPGAILLLCPLIVFRFIRLPS